MSFHPDIAFELEGIEVTLNGPAKDVKAARKEVKRMIDVTAAGCR